MIAAIRIGSLGRWESIKECQGEHDYRFTHESDEGQICHYVCRRCLMPHQVDLDAGLQDSA